MELIYICIYCEKIFSNKRKLNRHLVSLHKVEPQDSPQAPSPVVNRPIARSLNVADLVAKQWYDYDRSTFAFVKTLKEPGVKIHFIHQKDFDDNGVIYWIATNGRTVTEWVNPAQVGLVMVTASEGRNLQYGRLEDIRSHEASALNCHANDDKRPWFAIDLGLWLIPNCYTLKHARGYGRSALRNWLLQVSKDGFNWLTLFTHVDDCALNDPGSTASWPLDPPADEDQGWRHVRLQQTEKNASGARYLSLSGFEIYGTVTGVCDDLVSSGFYPTPGPFIMPVPDVNHQHSATITGVLEQIITEIKLDLQEHFFRTVDDYLFNRVDEWYSENFNKER